MPHDEAPDEYQVYVGVARSEQGAIPAGLEEAIVDAYEKAKGSGHRHFRVVDIIVAGENPITEYRVILRPHS